MHPTSRFHFRRPPLIPEQLGKLTKATKVYRGVSGMALPEQFWYVSHAPDVAFLL